MGCITDYLCKKEKMNYIFTVLSLFITFSSAMAQTADTVFLNAHISKLKHAKEYTLHVATLMPAEKYSYKPSLEEMDFGRQLLHIADNLCWLSSTYLTVNKNPLTEADTKATLPEDIIAVVAKAYDFAIDACKNFDTKSLAEPVKFFAGPINKLQIINLVQDHQTHHRAQLLVYLRLNGIKPPKYVGW
jgi:uncharacterized damage-inducible protein DinB